MAKLQYDIKNLDATEIENVIEWFDREIHDQADKCGVGNSVNMMVEIELTNKPPDTAASFPTKH
jgi:hypothetical protein